MSSRTWTELFFLDEAVALAAGHRPCFLCRRDAAEAFRSNWAEAKGCAKPSAGEIDSVLHRERLQGRRKRRHRVPVDIADLPDGTVVCLNDAAFTMVKGRAFRWTENDYDPPRTIVHADSMLTPPSSLMALEAGYRPVLHPIVDLYLRNSPS